MMPAKQNGLVIGAVPQVNLMPRPEVERRLRAQLMVRWAAALVVALLVVVVLVAGAGFLRLVAGQRLAVEQNRTTTLLSEIASMSEVSSALSTQRALEAFGAKVTTTDVEWARLHGALTDGLPSDARLVGFDLTVGGVPVGEDPAAEVALTGELTVASPTPMEIVNVIREYRRLPGVIDADGTSVTSVGDAGYTYLLTIEFDQTLYPAPPADEPTAEEPTAEEPSEEEE